MKKVVIVGGGPAGLRAAEVAVDAGLAVAVFEKMPSVGRKLLVAGRGGLNLTHEEAREKFAARYVADGVAEEFWEKLLEICSPEDLRAWAYDLGVRTFVQRTGRVYPVEMKAAPLLRSWQKRLREKGVVFHTRHEFAGWRRTEDAVWVKFLTGEGEVEIAANGVIFALGGGSWPVTGSAGDWVETMRGLGVDVAPLEAANCGWEVAWPEEVLAKCEGVALKNLEVSAENAEGERVSVRGELLVTKYGLEGGAIYALSEVLARSSVKKIWVDWKPEVAADGLLQKMAMVKRDVVGQMEQRWKLGEAARVILGALAGEISHEEGISHELAFWAGRVKATEISLEGARPIAEAISSRGGVKFGQLEEDLSWVEDRRIAFAGEMLDWFAPTGGYLLQGCFATGQVAAAGMAARLG